MRTNKIAVFILLASLILTAIPATATPDTDSTFFATAFVYKDIYNDEVMLWVQEAIGEQRIQGIIFMEDNATELLNAITDEKGRVQFIGVGEIENPTFQVTTTEAIITQILNSDNAVNTALEAVETGKIKYEAFGLQNKAKLKVATTTMDMRKVTREVATSFGFNGGNGGIENAEDVNGDAPTEKETITGTKKAVENIGRGVVEHAINMPEKVKEFVGGVFEMVKGMLSK